MTKSASESPSESPPVSERGNESAAPRDKNPLEVKYAPTSPIPDFRPGPNIIEQKSFPVPELSERGNCWANQWNEQEKSNA